MKVLSTKLKVLTTAKIATRPSNGRMSHVNWVSLSDT
jgi:hypothetical protein